MIPHDNDHDHHDDHTSKTLFYALLDASLLGNSILKTGVGKGEEGTEQNDGMVVVVVLVMMWRIK